MNRMTFNAESLDLRNTYIETNLTKLNLNLTLGQWYDDTTVPETTREEIVPIHTPTFKEKHHNDDPTLNTDTNARCILKAEQHTTSACLVQIKTATMTHTITLTEAHHQKPHTQTRKPPRQKETPHKATYSTLQWQKTPPTCST